MEIVIWKPYRLEVWCSEAAIEPGGKAPQNHKTLQESNIAALRGISYITLRILSISCTVKPKS